MTSNRGLPIDRLVVSTSCPLISPVTDSAHPLDAIQEIVIEPRSGWAALDFREIWQHRELAYFLAWRDIQVRYKQTVLGVVWAVLQPLMTMLVFTIFFGRLGRMDQQTTVPYPVFVYVSLLPWQFFSFCVTQCSQSLISSANLISKVYFPRLLVPLATVGVGIVDLTVASLLLIVLMLRYQIVPTLSLSLLPLLLTGLLIASVGVGTLLSALTVAYRDLRFVVPFLIQLWMFASPVAYSMEIVPERWRLVYSLNPMAGLISGFRSSLLGEPMHWDCLGVSLSTGVLAFLVGAFYFRTVERRFADIV